MAKGVKKSKMTLDKLAQIMQDEFLGVRKDMGGLRGGMQELSGDMQELRGDVQEGFTLMRKEIVGEVRDIVREGGVKVIASNEKMASKLDEFLKDRAAHDALHKGITDELHHHDQRIKKLEAKI